LFVESDQTAARVIRANMVAVGLPGGRLVTGTVAAVLRRGPDGESQGRGPSGSGSPESERGSGPGCSAGYHVVVADPPYAASDEEVSGMLTALLGGGWLAPGALVAVERASRGEPVSWPSGYTGDRSRRYGEATFWYGLAAGA
jgi:16S rRNA G966 N2-methylase RsmD